MPSNSESVNHKPFFMSFQFSSIAQSCLTLCKPMDCSTPGFPLRHQLPELTKTHVHWVGDAIQPSHPLLSPSPPAFNLSQHQGFFQSVSFSHQVAKVCPLGAPFSPQNATCGSWGDRWLRYYLWRLEKCYKQVKKMRRNLNVPLDRLNEEICTEWAGE